MYKDATLTILHKRFSWNSAKEGFSWDLRALMLVLYKIEVVCIKLIECGRELICKVLIIFLFFASIWDMWIVLDEEYRSAGSRWLTPFNFVQSICYGTMFTYL
jgi:hypothetical protein